MINFLRRRSACLLIDDDGPTAVEYALILAFLLVISIAILTTLGRSTSRSFGVTNAVLPVNAGGAQGGNSILGEVDSIVGGVAS